MANSNNMIMNLILVIALFIAVSKAEGAFLGIRFPKKAASTPQCESVFGVRSGDTCLAISQMFNMTAQLFSDLNPNLQCNKLFVGQWICTRAFSCYESISPVVLLTY
ncbi:hypothetical protein IFM89_008758 [Coptis chinensis]|uniref:LysM domain-containing protein n=1 Tax=Coptis chinensis TaxID=261450 RepID=A0A835H073_9MAGN|nr:hypothetical protein IFM89_008758 [Coptis chinensis]